MQHGVFVKITVQEWVLASALVNSWFDTQTEEDLKKVIHIESIDAENSILRSEEGKMWKSE